MNLLAFIKDPIQIRRVHAGLTFGWLFFGIIGLFTGMKSSIPALFFISVYANVAGHWSSWQAVNVEVKQDIEIAKQAP